MAVLATWVSTNVFTSDQDSRITAGNYGAQGYYVGTVATNAITSNPAFTILNIPGTYNRSQAHAFIKDAVKSDLTTNHGYTFGSGDDVVIL